MNREKINLETTSLETACQQLLDQYPEKVKAYKAGETGHIGFFCAMIIQRTNGQANAEATNRTFKKLLGK